MGLPTWAVRSTATGFNSSVSSPDVWKTTALVSSRTTSTRVPGLGPPATRNRRKGLVSLNAAEVSVPWT